MSETVTGRQNIDVSRYLDRHRLMHRIRAFEQAALKANEEKLVLGAIHPSIGQEATAAGIVANLRASDILLSTHRGHGHTLAKGADADEMMKELLGRDGGICKGKGGSMHIADFEVGMLGANGVVSANINIAAGAAHAIKLRGSDDITVCIFGDGAINRGPFLEGLNWAKVFNLPVLFVCEDNGFAATTRTATMTAGDGPSERARALGIPALDLDGNNVVALDEATTELIPAMRSGGGPRFITAKTYRLTGHTAADPAAYRDQSEVDIAWENDPIARCAELLKASGVDEAELKKQEEEARQEMEGVYGSAKAAPWPATDLAFADVQDIADPREEAARW